MADKTLEQRRVEAVDGVAYSPFDLREDETGGPAFYWLNPWSGKAEKIASLWWPSHPIEATSEIEALYENLELRDKRIKDIVSDAADAYDAGHHAGKKSLTTEHAALVELLREAGDVLEAVNNEWLKFTRYGSPMAAGANAPFAAARTLLDRIDKSGVV